MAGLFPQIDGRPGRPILREGGLQMKDTIKQIVEMDRHAREITETAHKERVHSEQEIAKRCEELRHSYLERAKHRIAVNEPKERAAAEADWKEKQAHLSALAQKMEEQYAANAESWADALVQRVLGRQPQP